LRNLQLQLRERLVPLPGDGLSMWLPEARFNALAESASPVGMPAGEAYPRNEQNICRANDFK
jgi:hypothetical protein